MTEQLYLPPIEEGSTYEMDDSNTRLHGLVDDLEGIIEGSKRKVGVSGRNTLTLEPEKVNELRESIRSERAWLELYREILNAEPLRLNIPEPEIPAFIKAITIPWWNEVLLDLKDASYDGQLSLELGTAHSYVARLVANGLVNANPPSVAGIVKSSDGQIVLGKRGGQNLPGTIMNVPAGYAKPHERDHLYESLWAELKEELGLVGEDIEYCGLFAAIKDDIPDYRNTHFIFFASSYLNQDDIQRRWEEESKDRGEHTNLIYLPDAREVDDYIEAHSERGKDYMLEQARLSLELYRTHL